MCIGPRENVLGVMFADENLWSKQLHQRAQIRVVHVVARRRCDAHHDAGLGSERRVGERTSAMQHAQNLRVAVDGARVAQRHEGSEEGVLGEQLKGVDELHLDAGQMGLVLFEKVSKSNITVPRNHYKERKEPASDQSHQMMLESIKDQNLQPNRNRQYHDTVRVSSAATLT